ncbi:MAG: hypothetical protein J3K34DRAFT_429651 [Monoraphidium minutum]|nr:MAG: hypothetical protein J3K34DRAFT_429651 [Monoraphidium minutum]
MAHRTRAGQSCQVASVPPRASQRSPSAPAPRPAARAAPGPAAPARPGPVMLSGVFCGVTSTSALLLVCGSGRQRELGQIEAKAANSRSPRERRPPRRGAAEALAARRGMGGGWGEQWGSAGGALAKAQSRQAGGFQPSGVGFIVLREFYPKKVSPLVARRCAGSSSLTFDQPHYRHKCPCPRRRARANVSVQRPGRHHARRAPPQRRPAVTSG